MENKKKSILSNLLGKKKGCSCGVTIVEEKDNKEEKKEK